MNEEEKKLALVGLATFITLTFSIGLIYTTRFLLNGQISLFNYLICTAAPYYLVGSMFTAIWVTLKEKNK